MGSRARPSSGSRPPVAAVAPALSGALVADLARVLPQQRWFGSKGRAITAVSVADWTTFGAGAWFGLVDVSFRDGPPERYAVPLVLGAPGALAVPLEAAGSHVCAADAFEDPGFCLELLAAFDRGTTVATQQGGIRFVRTEACPRDLVAAAPRRLTGEQSNTSVAYGDEWVLKALRRIEPGISLDYEVGRFLTARAAFAHVPAVAGAIEYVPAAGPVATLAVLQRYVPNRGDAWTWVVDHLERLAPDGAVEASDAVFAGLRRLGAVTGELHGALAADTSEPDFAPAPITASDVGDWSDRIARDVRRTCAALAARVDALPAAVGAGARALLAREPELSARARDLEALAAEGCARIRVHGDYHLGQTLRTDEGFVILDFEGEPARALAERRGKQSALVDVAGMLRSLEYAADTTLGARDAPPDWVERWVRGARAAFLDGYLGAAARAPVRLVPASRAGLARVLAALEVGKALYEVRYEIDHRPAWLALPLRGLDRLLRRPR